jgi:hypothetical protein
MKSIGWVVHGRLEKDRRWKGIQSNRLRWRIHWCHAHGGENLPRDIEDIKALNVQGFLNLIFVHLKKRYVIFLYIRVRF